MITVKIEPSGRMTVVECSLKDWQEAVGGYVQAFAFGYTGCSALVNENGKMERLPENVTATLLCAGFGVGLAQGDYIVGTMLIIGLPDKDGNTTDVPDKMLEALKMKVKRSCH